MASSEMHQAAIHTRLGLDAALLGAVKSRRVIGNRRIKVAQLLMPKRAISQCDRAILDALAPVLDNMRAGDDRDFRLAGAAANGIATVAGAVIRALGSSQAGHPGNGQESERRGCALLARPRGYGDRCFPGHGCLIVSAGENEDNEGL
jgi:hypothetical protein